MLKIYYLASEINPFSGTNTIGSFSKEFSSILKQNKDIDIRLTQPKYGYVSDRRYILREVIRLKNLLINFNGKEELINLKSGFIPNTRVQVYFMEHEEYFKSTGDLVYKSRNGRVYSNNNERFTFFAKAAIETLAKLYWIPDYIICNDWQMSMLPKLFFSKFKDKLKDTKIISIIHNIDDNYKFDNKLFKSLDLEYNKKLKKQNTLLDTLEYSDYTYILNDENDNAKKIIQKDINLKNSLQKENHSIIDYSTSLDTSERIQVYNDILKKLQK